MPTYVAPSQGSSGSRRLLLISYHFPPGATAGALRWQKFAGYAAARGWALDVISVHPEDLGRVDARRLEDLPPGTRVFGVHHRLPAFDRIGKRFWEVIKSARTVLRPGRGENAPPSTDAAGKASGAPESLAPEEMGFSLLNRGDLRRAFHAWLHFVRAGVWADAAAGVGFRMTDAVSYDAVVTCGPPHMAHVAGRKVAERASVPFAMDLRDPWSILRRRPEPTASPVWFRIAGRHERRTTRAADLVVVNTEAVRRAMEERYPEARDYLVTVTNGADDLVERRPASSFVVSYAGAIYLDRDPRPLFRAASAVIQRHALAPEAFRIELVGRVESFNGVSTLEIAREEGVEAHVDIRPPEPHESLMERLARSSVLVSLPQDSPWAIPSKVFEYMQFRAWLLVYADPGTPTWDLLEGSGVHLVRPDDVDAGAEVLNRCYRGFRDGEEPSCVAEDEQRFTRSYQAGRFFDALEDVAGPAVREGPT